MVDNLEEQECENCGLIGTLKRGKIGEAMAGMYDKTIGRSVGEPNAPVEGILCTACGYKEPLEPETV
jgi:hypothetical protein